MWKVWLLCIRSVERKTSRLIRWMIEERTSMKVIDNVWMKHIFLNFSTVPMHNWCCCSCILFPKNHKLINFIQNALIICHKNLHWKLYKAWSGYHYVNIFFWFSKTFIHMKRLYLMHALMEEHNLHKKKDFCCYFALKLNSITMQNN